MLEWIIREIFGGSNGEKKLVIDAVKFIAELGLNIETLTAEDIKDSLMKLSEEEREELFTKCSIFSDYFDLVEKSRSTLLAEGCFRLVDEERNYFDIIDREKRHIRVPEEIKKDLKYEKNPMRKKQLNKELTESYRYFKYRR